MFPILHSSILLPTLLLLAKSSANPVAINPNLNGISIWPGNLPFSIPNSPINPPPPAPTSINSNLTFGKNSTSDLGINCNGSPFGCIGASNANIMHVLRDYMSLLQEFPTIHYVAGQKIACKEHSVFPFLVRGYFCAFLEGNNVPSAGVTGPTLLLKMQQLIEHGCQGCGSVPLSEDNDPNKMGKLTINYVAKSECVGLCFYGQGGFVQEMRFDGDTDETPQPRRMLGALNTGASPFSSVAYVPPVTLASWPNAKRTAAPEEEADLGRKLEIDVPSITSSASSSTANTTATETSTPTSIDGQRVISWGYIAPHTIYI